MRDRGFSVTQIAIAVLECGRGAISVSQRRKVVFFLLTVEL